jgi:hypothetical protein
MIHMTDVHPRFQQQCFVSFNKFDSSIERVIDRTFSLINFDRDQSVLPTYIGIDVAYEADRELLKATRRLFQRLRQVHQKHFVRFVTDTVWAMESGNGDIFYCHDQEKQERVDIIWSIKALSTDQFEINIVSTPDNRRREILTELQYNLNKTYTVPANKDVRERLDDIVAAFYLNTKNIRNMQFLQEDCHIMLVHDKLGRRFRPILIPGLSPMDAKIRWRSIKGQLEYQRQNHYEYFTNQIELSDLIECLFIQVDANGAIDQPGFSARVQYDTAEWFLSTIDASGEYDRTPNDVFIFHSPDVKPVNIEIHRYGLQYIADSV